MTHWIRKLFVGEILLIWLRIFKFNYRLPHKVFYGTAWV